MRRPKELSSIPPVPNSILCIDTIGNTYPFIKIKKNIIDDTLINNLNTIKVKINNKFLEARIDSEDYYFDDNLNTYTEYLNILIIDNNKENLNNIDFYIFKNNYLPNLIDYTTFGENTNNIADINSYFLQKPMLFSIVYSLCCQDRIHHMNSKYRGFYSALNCA